MASLRELYNTAIGEWAGFLYQGLCGIYHSLWLLENDWGGCQEHTLWLDSYEDFAIKNSENKLIYLVQCKDVKGVKNYRDEFVKMLDKKKAYGEKKWLADNVQLFFICHEYVETVPEINRYNLFPENKETCDPIEISSFLKVRLQALYSIILHRSNVNLDFIIDKLARLVNDKVFEIQQKYFDSKGVLARDIAFEHGFIHFSEIIHVLMDDGVYMDSVMVNSYIRNKYVFTLNTLAQELKLSGEKVDFERIGNLAQIILAKDDLALKTFLQRTFPQKEQTQSLADFMVELSNSSGISHFLDVVNEVNFILDRELQWHENGKVEIPTALFVEAKKANRIGIICQQIYKNSANLDIMNECDYLVGDIPEFVIDITSRCEEIHDVDGVKNDPNNIFNQKRVGILDINTMNDGKYS